MPVATFVRWIGTMLLALVFLMLHTTSAQAETVIGSTSVTADTTWSAAGSPYIVGNINVNNGATLTIEPGAELRFAANGWMAVNGGGNLVAEGTADQPVKFTSNASNPAPGDWFFLVLHTGSTARLSHCDVAYAGRDGFHAVNVHASGVTIRDCRIHDNQRDAVVLNPAEVAATLERVQIDNNGGIAIAQTTPDMSPVYTDLTLSDNGTNAIFMPDGTLRRNHSFDGAAAGAPFLLSQLTIADGYTLTVAPGTELRFVTAGWMAVNGGGNLVAEGTADQPVKFTSNASNPAPGDWFFLVLHTGSTARLSHCDIAYAGRDGFGAVDIRSLEVYIRECAIHDNQATAIAVQNARPALTANRLYANGFGINNLTPQTVVFAWNHWWGHYRGPYHAVLNPAGQGDAVSNGVRFDPWKLGDGTNSAEVRLLDTVSPGQAGNTGPVTLELLGAGYHLTPTAQLIAPNGSELAIQRQDIDSNFRMLATFDLTEQQLGQYDVRVVWDNGAQQTLTDVVEVIQGAAEAEAWVRLEVPTAVRTGRPFRFTLHYGNDTSNDMPSPLMTLQVSPGMKWQYMDGPYHPNIILDRKVQTPALGDLHTTPSIEVLGISPDGDAGILRPGQSATLVFSATWSLPNPDPLVRTWFSQPEQMVAPERMVTLAGYDPTQPPWSDTIAALAPRFGGSFATYQRALAEEATVAGDLGVRTPIVSELRLLAVNRTAATFITESLAATSTQAVPQARLIPDATSADRPLCIEEHSKYATDPSTYGDGSRVPDGRWVSWPNAMASSADSIDIGYYRSLAFGFTKSTNLYFWDSVVAEWIAHFRGGTGTPWQGTYDHPISAQAAEFIDQVPDLKSQIAGVIHDEVEAHVIANEPPAGISEITLDTTVIEGLHFAKYTVPDAGNALWNLGQTSLALGRSPVGNNIGYKVDLFYDTESFVVTYRAREVPARIEDVFQIWEEKVNHACKLAATGEGCPGYKRDFLLLFEWAYMLDLFDTARCFDWYINMHLPYFEGQVLLAGVEAQAGGDQTIMLNEGQEQVDVALNGSARLALATLMGPEDEIKPFVWSGIPDPEDAQNTSINLRAGNYVFILEANAKGRLDFEGRTFSDLDTTSVSVIPYDPEDEKMPIPVRSYDPNDKVAPAGIQGSAIVLPDSTLPYIIHFENDAEQATAPAQIVKVTDKLDANFDLTTFEFTEFGFGPHIIPLPPGLKHFETEVDLTSYGIDLYVAVEGELDSTTGEVTWLFTSLDPATRELTDDALAGFLPPNDATHRGEGFVSFQIKPKADVALGTTVPNFASIIFDDNAPIITNTATVIVGTADQVRKEIRLPTILR